MATIFDLQAKNRRKTKIIVVCFVLFFIWLGLGLDLSIYLMSGGSSPKYENRYQRTSGTYPPNGYSEKYAPVKKSKPFYPIFTVIVGLTGTLIAWWSMRNASENVLKTMMAKPAEKQNSKAEQTLINIVEEMCIASGLAPPKVWIIPDDDPNALATGLKDGDYHIAVTQGLIKALTREELQAVVAHEIAHLKNDDTRLMTAMIVLVGAAAMISEFVSRFRFFGIGIGDRDSDSSDSKLGIIIFVLWLVSALLAPIVTHLMTLMISREREYLADASSAQFTRNPEALAKALEKIARAEAPTQLVRPASAMLCIASPSAADLEEDEGWFATHPPIRKRIARLRSIGVATV
jgi:heat shock protein HtpX